MTEDRAARRFELSGRVQGVGFRWWTRSLARELHLTGSVRNLADGNVEIIAAGGADALSTFEAQLREGPPGARVETLYTLATELAETRGFEIAR